MARIGIDAHAIGENLTGNETYIANLISGISSIESGHQFTLLFTRRDLADRWSNKYDRVETALIRPSTPLIRIPFSLPYLAWRRRIDLLHVQYVSPPLIQIPVVTTIHDISFEKYPDLFSAREVAQFRMTIPMSARRAAKVITISENSKKDLIEFYGLKEEDIVVTYLGVSSIFSPVAAGHEEIMKKYGIDGPYILTVGNLQPRKNLQRLVAAYVRLRNSRPDIKHKLVIVGKRAWRHDPIIESAKQSRWAKDILLTDYVPEDDLPVLYSGASVFVYPSIYEGFGLPPLEAMACGVPVITSDRSSLPEVVGDAAIKINPFDVEAIAASMASVILEPSVASKMRQDSVERASLFSWEKCARQTVDIFENILGIA
ncbi:MAG: glycosyltransferase family 4 protein [Thermoleophilia bacterium]